MHCLSHEGSGTHRAKAVTHVAVPVAHQFVPFLRRRHRNAVVPLPLPLPLIAQRLTLPPPLSLPFRLRLAHCHPLLLVDHALRQLAQLGVLLLTPLLCKLLHGIRPLVDVVPGHPLRYVQRFGQLRKLVVDGGLLQARGGGGTVSDHPAARSTPLRAVDWFVAWAIAEDGGFCEWPLREKKTH